MYDHNYNLWSKLIKYVSHHFLAKKKEEEDEDDMADLQAWAAS